MDIQTRIRRRQDRTSGAALLKTYETIAPVSHVEEPVGRGPLVEQLLDHLDPVFDGTLPVDGYLYGPPGSGKSALVSALFAKLDRHLTGAESAIRTRTRVESLSRPSFVYVDTRQAASEFGFYHTILDQLSDEDVPREGIGTETIGRRLAEHVADTQAVVVAVDHLMEPATLERAAFRRTVENLPDTVSWLAIGRKPPSETPFGTRAGTTIEVEPYKHRTLVDLLMTRAASGLTDGSFDYGQARALAEWSEGNAHDALAALFVAAAGAEATGEARLTDDAIQSAMSAVPHPSVPLSRVLTLPENQQRILREFVSLEERDRESVTDTTEAISAAAWVDLSQGTIKRLLYEMADAGLIELETAVQHDSRGRPPSRVVPQFPETAFHYLYDLRHDPPMARRA